MVTYLEKAKARFEKLRIVRPDQLRPCTEEEVRRLGQQVGLSLPEAYKEFLLWMGHGAGGFLRGSDCFYKQLIPLQRWAVELMEEDGFTAPLPADAFVFLMHQGYQFDFFRTGEGDDPPVYYYFEGAKEGSITIVYPHFSELLLALVEMDAELLEDVAKRHPEKAKLNASSEKLRNRYTFLPFSIRR